MWLPERVVIDLDVSMWYKRAERQYRIALFFSAASLAGAFGGVLAYGIGFMRGIGGLNGWVSLHTNKFWNLQRG